MSSADIETKRAAITAAYPNSRTWPKKVAKFHDGQVLKVYQDLKNRGKI